MLVYWLLALVHLGWVGHGCRGWRRRRLRLAGSTASPHHRRAAACMAGHGVAGQGRVRRGVAPMVGTVYGWDGVRGVLPSTPSPTCFLLQDLPNAAGMFPHPTSSSSAPARQPPPCPRVPPPGHLLLRRRHRRLLLRPGAPHEATPRAPGALPHPAVRPVAAHGREWGRSKGGDLGATPPVERRGRGGTSVRGKRTAARRLLPAHAMRQVRNERTGLALPAPHPTHARRINK